MAKMNDLSIEGVTDIHSYGVGFTAGREYIETQYIEVLELEMDSLVELGATKDYLEGLEHAILLFKALQSTQE